MTAALRIACVTEKPDRNWVWLERKLTWRRPIEWTFYRTGPRGPIDRAIRKPLVGRVTEGLRLRSAARRGDVDLIVTHLPYVAAWIADLVGDDAGGAKRLAFAFNYTDLPSGAQQARMKRSFKRIDRFTVFSTLERDLYARHFAIPLERIDVALWGAQPPIDASGPRQIAEPYAVALGGEARDYATFAEAARLAPRTLFVAITRPWSLDGIAAPPNLRHFINLPWNDAWSLVQYADAAVVPLRDDLAPNGMVTFVGGMHLGKAQVVTRSAGLADYAIDNETALLVPPGDANALKIAVERLMADRALASRIGDNARKFAAAHCSEAATIAYFENFLDRTFPEAS
ncbi:MAG: glycosyltransferase [Parvularculaceae bacterium]|nr:glycosyltransferase [Parvularculaceae bacterium]